ncbi:HTH-type transcriptional regulator DmlR (plasmid) [Roseovarius sp. THAF8]|uniref:LysR family transcriptional regulator n=1 Tax=Roseovarius sp. THAF8 TaxID=2587846 RepID=UPI00126888E1|nr:LysR family transcriptional regulator [Roseovarius sp. THAF8]QFT99880.1 HTH-type transcriptional regulator DmlR [Roseovarius sp. THAF8]
MHELPQTRDLVAFVAIVEDNGFAEASRRLGVAPSTLSRTVSRLEQQLGVTLLRRTTRMIEMTPEGRDFLDTARDILARAEALAELGTSGRTPRGPLRVNAPVPFLLHAIAPRLPEFRARYPEIRLRFDMTDDVIDLIGAHADVAIRFGPLEDSDLLKRPLGRTPWKLVAAPHYLDAQGWPEMPGDLARLAQVRFSAPAHINLLEFRGMDHPVEVPAAVEASNGEAVRRLVVAGCGIARFSDFMVAEDLKAGRLVELFPGEVTAEPLEMTALYLTRASGLRRLAVFLDWLKEIVT